MIAELIIGLAVMRYFDRREPSALETEACLRLAKIQEARETAKAESLRAEARATELKIQETIRLRSERFEREADRRATERRFERNLRAAQREARRQKWAVEGYVFQP